MIEGRGQRADGRGEKADGRGEKAEGRGQKAELPSADCIPLTAGDQRDGLRIWRELQRQQDLLHVAENNWRRWTAQMEALYHMPAGWRMTDILRGFEHEKGDKNGR